MIGNISVISEILGLGVDHGFEDQIAIERSGYDTPEIARAATEWLSRNGEKPFLLYLHFHAPHAPYRPPLRDLFGAYESWHSLTSYPSVSRWLYNAAVAYTDRYVETVVKALKELQLDKSTTILLTADHGEHFEVRKFVDNQLGQAYIGSFLDHGATLYQDEIHVPLLIYSPNTAEKFQTIDDFVSGLDIAPTLLKLASLPIPQYCAGKPLLPKPNRERTILSEGFRARSVIFGDRYKYIRSYQPTEKRLYSPGRLWGKRTAILDREQLFDLATDPKEQKNLVDHDIALTKLAHEAFAKTYGLPIEWQLVIEATGKTAEISVPADYAYRSDTPLTKTALGNGTMTLEGTIGDRLVLHFPKFSLEKARIAVDKKPVAITETRFRLPLDLQTGSLPEERSPVYDSDAKQNYAYVRKVEVDKWSERHITTGDARFRQILMEWGYLNDQDK